MTVPLAGAAAARARCTRCPCPGDRDAAGVIVAREGERRAGPLDVPGAQVFFIGISISRREWSRRGGSLRELGTLDRVARDQRRVSAPAGAVPRLRSGAYQYQMARPHAAGETRARMASANAVRRFRHQVFFVHRHDISRPKPHTSPYPLPLRVEGDRIESDTLSRRVADRDTSAGLNAQYRKRPEYSLGIPFHLSHKPALRSVSCGLVNPGGRCALRIRWVPLTKDCGRSSRVGAPG